MSRKLFHQGKRACLWRVLHERNRRCGNVGLKLKVMTGVCLYERGSIRVCYMSGSARSSRVRQVYNRNI
jgi:hypothetical protein